MAPPPQDPFLYDRQGSDVPQGTGEQVRDKGFPVFVRTDDGQFHPVLQGANGAYYESGGKQLPLFNPSDPSLGPKFYRYQGDDPNQAGQQPYYEEADSRRILNTIDRSVSGEEGAAQWTPDRITSDAVARTVDPRTLTSPGTDGTNSLGKINKPGSFTGAVATASSAKLAEIHGELTRINKDVHSTLLDAAVLKARTKDYDVRYTYLTWLITDTKARMNQLPIGDSDKRAQAQAYIDYQQKQLDSARALFTAYLTQLTGASNAANKPRTGEHQVGRQEAPPPVGVPQAQTAPQGGSPGGGVPASGGSGSTSGDIPGTTTGANPTAQTAAPGTTKKGLDADDILSQLQQNGQPVGTTGQPQPTVMPMTATPAVNPTAQRSGQPMTTGMPVSYTGSPSSTTTAGQPMSDADFNNLLAQIKSGGSRTASTPSEDIPTVTTSIGSPAAVPGAVPTAQPASVPNLSTASTRTTSTTPGSGAPSGGDGGNGRPTTSGMPVMPMAPMMGNPGGQGGRKNAGGESSVKSEQDLGSRLGGPVATTTPVVNDKKNRNVLPDDDASTAGTRT